MNNLYYSLLTKDQVKSKTNSIVNEQKSIMLSKVNMTSFKKDSVILENKLNEFFYGNNRSNDQYYNRAIEIANQAFDERWKNYPFTLDANKLTASTAAMQAKGINFVNRTSTLDEVKSVVAAITELFKTINPTPKLQEALNRISKIQSVSNWKDVREVNGIVASILYGNKTVYGEAFELPLAAFGAMVTQGVDATVDDVLNKYFMAQNRSSTSVNISKVPEAQRQRLNFSRTQQINEGLMLQYSNPTQDKVDVSFRFADTDYAISAKSYSSLYKDIHILGGTSLAVPVLNLFDTDFTNIYLSRLFYSGMSLEKTHEALRVGILLMALSGYGTGQDKNADTFVLNDKSKKHIYVRNISQIINSIVKQNNWSAVKFANGIAAGTIPDIPLHNYCKKHKGGPVIPAMINDLHRQKLMVSIKGTAIKNSI